MQQKLRAWMSWFGWVFVGSLLGWVLGLALPHARVMAVVPQALENRRIVAVEIVGETRGVMLPSEVGIPLGARLSRSLVQEAVQKLLSTGRWADVQIDAVLERDRGLEGQEESGEVGVRLMVLLVPRLVVARMDVRGNRVLSDDDIVRVLDIRRGVSLPSEASETVPQAIRDFYAERGYEQTEVSFVLRDTDDPSRKAVLIQITEGPPTRIAGLRFQGETPPRESRVTRVMGISPGDLFEQHTLDDAIRRGEQRLHDQRWYEASLSFSAIERTDAGVIIVIESHVGKQYRVEVRGHGPVDSSDVLDVLRLGEDRLRPSVLEVMALRVQDLYARRGYPNAAVNIRRLRTRHAQVARMLVEVSPGHALRIVETQFVTDTDDEQAPHFTASFLQEQVRSYLVELLGAQQLLGDPVDDHTADLIFETQESRPRDRPPPLLVEHIWYAQAYENAVAHMEKLYQSAGYLSARVGPARLEFLRDVQQGAVFEKRGRVIIPIVQGPRTMLHALRIDGSAALSQREVAEVMGLSRGAAFSRTELDEAVRRVHERYAEQGMLYAQIKQGVRFSPDRTRAEVILSIEERFPVYIGAISIEGAVQTKERMIRRLLTFSPGDLYRPSVVRETQDRLMQLGVFTSVHIAPKDMDLPARKKPIVITVSERRTQYLDLRAGLSTAEGIRGGFEYGYRNLFGYGIGLTFSVQLANQFLFLDQTLETRFQNLSLIDRLERRITGALVFPYIPGLPNTRMSMSLTHQRENERSFGLDANLIDLTLSVQPKRWITFRISQSLENNNVDLFTDESYDELLTNTPDPRLRRLLRVPEGRSTVFASKAAVTADFRDNPFNPSRGFFGVFNLEWVHSLGSERVAVGGVNQDFYSHHLRISVTASGYVPLGHTKSVFAVQSRFGRVIHLQDRSETYPNRQFFLGGVDTIRGYLQDAMIPQDLTAEVVTNPDLSPQNVVQGGDTFLTLRGELRFPIFGIVQGGLFADFGNLWADARQINLAELRPTAGAGIRFATPVGPVAFDFGILLRRRQALNERFGAFHFSIGLF